MDRVWCFQKCSGRTIPVNSINEQCLSPSEHMFEISYLVNGDL